MELQAQLMRAQVREGKQRRGWGGDGHAVQRYAVYDACLLTHCTHVCKHGRTLTHMHTRTRSRAHTHTHTGTGQGSHELLVRRRKRLREDAESHPHYPASKPKP